MKTLVFGNGWLGNKIVERFGGQMALGNILDVNHVEEMIDLARPDVVVNAAAKCGRPNIDWCALPENRRITEAVNGYGPRILEKACLDAGAKFVHISSGCIWEDGSDIDELELADPPSYYASTKVMGECTLKGNSTLIIRPRMPVDGTLSPRNLITKLSGYNMVLQEHNSVTVVDDLLEAMAVLLKKDCTGVYHVANPSWTSAAEIMEMYCEIVDQNHAFQIVNMEYLWKHKLIRDGRSNVVLNTDKLRAEGIELGDAKVRVRECMEEYARCKSNTSQEAG